ncbi:MAG: hypothetical protein GXY58_20200 [Planctomycetaceae bacterium]|nr:hypothetical protein [Planctomycetaceae bacterium]
MRLRVLVTVAASAVLFVGGQQLSAQQMSPYPMMGGYPAVAPVGYPVPYTPAMPATYDVGQEAGAAAVPPAADCNGCGQPECMQCACGCNCWNHKIAVFGEFLYLRARNSEVAYGVPIDGPIIGPPPTFPIQIGRYGVVDQDHNPGFRFGVNYVLDGWSSVTAQYTYFDSESSDMVGTDAPNVVRAVVFHPATLSAAQDFLTAEASHDIGFQFLDVDYRRALSCDDRHNVTFLAGVRVAEFDQDFAAIFNGTGNETLITEIDFYGAGLRIGLEGERYTASRRWLVYGKTHGSFVAGEFTADYRQGQSFDPSVVDTSWEAGRIVPMLDLEVGAGWQSRCGTWRITGGYMISAWYNCVKTDEWISAVQNNNVVGLGDNMSFDGLVLRCEGRF